LFAVVNTSINYRKCFLPDGAATSDMDHVYQPERTPGFKHQGLPAREALGHKGLNALTALLSRARSDMQKLEYRRDRI
jgi:hypothetical protein